MISVGLRSKRSSGKLVSVVRSRQRLGQSSDKAGRSGIPERLPPCAISAVDGIDGRAYSRDMQRAQMKFSQS